MKTRVWTCFLQMKNCCHCLSFRFLPLILNEQLLKSPFAAGIYGTIPATDALVLLHLLLVDMPAGLLLGLFRVLFHLSQREAGWA